MGLPRSTFYDVPAAPVGDVELVAKIVVICDEARERPATQAPPTERHQDQQRSRESDFPDLARDQKIDGPNQLWVADITYIAIETGFVYLAVILDAWSRRVVRSAARLMRVWRSRRLSRRFTIAIRRRAAFTTRIAVRNMRRPITESSSPHMASLAP
jgi:putative transposase